VERLALIYGWVEGAAGLPLGGPGPERWKRICASAARPCTTPHNRLFSSFFFCFFFQGPAARGHTADPAWDGNALQASPEQGACAHLRLNSIASCAPCQAFLQAGRHEALGYWQREGVRGAQLARPPNRRHDPTICWRCSTPWLGHMNLRLLWQSRQQNPSAALKPSRSIWRGPLGRITPAPP